MYLGSPAPVGPFQDQLMSQAARAAQIQAQTCDRPSIAAVQEQTLTALENLKTQLLAIAERVRGAVPQNAKEACREIPGGVVGKSNEIRSQVAMLQELAGQILCEF